jgi:hypothetical protein
MARIITHISTITLKVNVNIFHSPSKRHIQADWIQNNIQPFVDHGKHRLKLKKIS